MNLTSNLRSAITEHTKTWLPSPRHPFQSWRTHPVYLQLMVVQFWRIARSRFWQWNDFNIHKAITSLIPKIGRFLFSLRVHATCKEPGKRVMYWKSLFQPCATTCRGKFDALFGTSTPATTGAVSVSPWWMSTFTFLSKCTIFPSFFNVRPMTVFSMAEAADHGGILPRLRA
jgi:hypothetical protein